MNFTQPKRRTVIAVIIALLVGTASIVGFQVASAYRTATVEYDGVTVPVSGFLSTVDEALEAAQVSLGEHDEVAPNRGEQISNNARIVVRRAFPYMIEENGETREIWSTASSVETFMESLNGGVVMAANRSAERGPVPLFATSGRVTIKVDGQTKDVDVTSNDTPATVLKKANVELSAIDRYAMVNENGNLIFKVDRITRGNKTTTEPIPAPVEERDDDSMYEGESKVIQEGAEGVITTTTYVETVNGQVTVERQVSQQRTEPVARIIAHGTKPEPQPEPVRHASPSRPVASGDVWAALAQCESGGNPSINTGNGFYGMYQFSLPTWHSVGGSGLPSDASAAEQTMRAQILQQRSGWGQWPACSRSLGLY